jgi:hypothetical protein
MKIGKPKYGNDFVPTKYWKLKDGESTYRILPPLGELADDGIWSIFYKVHYGYRNSQGRMRVFQSSLVQNRKTKMTEVPDAAIERIDKLRAELEKAKAAGAGPAINKFKELLQIYNLDNNHYVNAMDMQGNIGVLKLRHRAMKALEATIKKLNVDNVDPLSPEDGRFFTFTRSGNGLDTTFQVGVAQESFDVPNVGKVKRDIVHRLTPEVISRLGREARELHKLFKKPTAEEIARIVKESDLETGKSRAVDEILDVRGGSDESDYGDDGNDGSPGGSSGAVGGNFGSAGTGTGSGSLSANTVTNPVSSSTTSPTVGAAGDTQAAIGSTPSTQTTAQRVSNMSEEEFQKYLSTLGI